MNGRASDAEQDFRTAISQADIIPVGPGSPGDLRRAKASAAINLAEILILKNQLADAHGAANQAVDLLRSLTELPPVADRETRDRWLLSMALTNRAVATKEGGNHEHALEDLEEACRIASEVPQDDYSFEDAQFQLALISNHYGQLLARDQARLSESDDSYEKALGILNRLIQDHKLIPHYREEMAVTLSRRASLRLLQDRTTDAQHDCEAAQEHIVRLLGEQSRHGSLENPQYLSLLGEILAVKSRIQTNQGQVTEGRKTLEEAMEKLSRAVEIDPSRVADKVKLDQMKAVSAHSQL